MNLSVHAPQELKGVMGITGLPGIHYKGDGFKHLSSAKVQGGDPTDFCSPTQTSKRAGASTSSSRSSTGVGGVEGDDESKLKNR